MKNHRGKVKIFTDERGGELLPIEFKDLLFDAKRVFTVCDVPINSIRGEHAHYETEQILICVRGSILVSLDYGSKIDEVVINSGEYIFIDKMVWDSQKFLTGNDFMIVLCSTNYNLKDYILDKDEFYKITKK